MRSRLLNIMIATSVVFVVAYRAISGDNDYSLFVTLVLAGFIISTVFLCALDAIMTSWIRAWFGSIDFFLDEYFKEVERREKERKK